MYLYTEFFGEKEKIFTANCDLKHEVSKNDQ